MRAIGFGDPVDCQSPEGKLRSVISLRTLPTDLSRIPSLPPDILSSLRSKRADIEHEIVALEGAPSVSAAIRIMREVHSLSEVRMGVETALTAVRNVLQHPKDIKMYRIKTGNPTFHRTLGRLHGSDLLMHSIGFSGSGQVNSVQTVGTGADSQGAISDYKKSGFAVYILKTVSMDGKAPSDANFDIMASTAGRSAALTPFPMPVVV